MTHRSIRNLVAALLLTLLSGCGSPGAKDICDRNCDSLRGCNYANETQAANCHTDCQNNQGKYQDDDNKLAMDCKNAGDLRDQQMACYDNTTCRGNVIEYGLAIATCIADPVINRCLKP